MASSMPTYDPARSFDSASLTASYQDVGAVMASPVLGYIIYNDSTVAVQISFNDGSTDGPIIPAGGSFSDNRYVQYNNYSNAYYVLPTGAQIQIKQVTAAGTGSVYVNIARGG